MEYVTLSKLSYGDQAVYEQAYHDRFHSPYAQHVDIKIADWPAFFLVTPEICEHMLTIQKVDKSIWLLCGKLPGIATKHFSRRCLIDEIILTNGIEGVHSTRREIDGVLAELERNHKQKRFAGLVQKYDMLLQGAEFPLSTCEDIREIYDDLVLREVSGSDPKNIPDGVIFRKEIVDVTDSSQKVVHQGLYPEEKIIDAMEKALKYLGDPSAELLYRVSVFHYLLGYIHPFYDGNGRLNRFISSYMLGKELHPLLGYRLSYTIKENITEYYKAYKTCNLPRNRGDLTPFVLMFLAVIEKSTRQLFSALTSRLDALNHYKEIIGRLPHGQERDCSNLYYVLIQVELFSEHGITMKELAKGRNLSPTTLRGQLKKVEDAGLLKVTLSGHAKCYGIDLDQLDKY